MLDAIRKVTNVLVVILFSLLVLSVSVEVFCRFVLHSSLVIVDELARYTFVWLIYLGGTITIRNGMNITFDLVLDALPPRSWKVLFTVVNIISMLFLLIVTVLGANLAWVNRVQASSIMKVNMGLVMMAIPIGGFLMLCEQINYYLRRIRENQTDGGGR